MSETLWETLAAQQGDAIDFLAEETFLVWLRGMTEQGWRIQFGTQRESGIYRYGDFFDPINDTLRENVPGLRDHPFVGVDFRPGKIIMLWFHSTYSIKIHLYQYGLSWALIILNLSSASKKVIWRRTQLMENMKKGLKQLHVKVQNDYGHSTQASKIYNQFMSVYGSYTDHFIHDDDMWESLRKIEVFADHQGE
ncbi:MAG: hypothetical protein UT24_C0011G0005 [Candidatus Woesebacteria bacterium GW2011_GWB1_39_12]|uniref:Uncharacterized protein n=1 Tax=Candidatus Woesebacteria bacterium GW2011_GWB1_39_12 TaxID=1618574 RepID=A0A0G0QFN9_9BACT|nr:MAG: hypothetical protein UT24_C0011G0005 [Candidatus Woesebacteria bacterium GW2011_GWB1_39_12]